MAVVVDGELGRSDKSRKVRDDNCCVVDTFASGLAAVFEPSFGVADQRRFPQISGLSPNPWNLTSGA